LLRGLACERQRAQGFIEYGFIIVLVSLTAIAALTAISDAALGPNSAINAVNAILGGT